MTLNASGPIAIGGCTTGVSIAKELGLTTTAQHSLNCTSYRTLSGQSSGAVSMNAFHGKSNGPTPGSQSYTARGTYTWVAPANVTNVSVVAIGGGGGNGGSYHCCCDNSCQGGGGGSGGGLGYKNNITVVPGNSYTVQVGSGQCTTYRVAAQCSWFSSSSLVRGGPGDSSISGIAGGTYTGDGGGNGGRGGGNSGSPGGGGGGAGGYSGAGGNGGQRCCVSTAGSGGGGGGGWKGTNQAGTRLGGAGGGGVGLFGQGSSGAAGSGACRPGKGGSGGGNGCVTGSSGGCAGTYGGGAGGGTRNAYCYPGGNGSQGAVRIVWPGSSRRFPSTCVGSP